MHNSLVISTTKSITAEFYVAVEVVNVYVSYKLYVNTSAGSIVYILNTEGELTPI